MSGEVQVQAEHPKYPLECPKGCMYQAGDDGGCNYILIEDKMRGCEPGPDCTKYKSRTEARKKREISLGNPDKRKPEKGLWDVQTGFDLWRQGMSQADIARELGISLGAVKWRKQHYWVFGKA